MYIPKDHRFYRFLALLWMALIFWLSSKSNLPAPTLFWGQDKLAHALVFGILGLLFCRSFNPREENLPWNRILLITVLVGAFGCFDEIHQLFVPGREASIWDVAADTFGGLLASLIIWKR